MLSLLAAGLCLLFMAATPALAQVDQVIYADSLQNGWENWSWATVAFNNKNPKHAGTASIKVTAGSYQAIYLHHSAFNTSGFTNLVFWIHGGTTGGQQLQITAVLGGAGQTPVPLTPPLAGTWTQVVVPLSSLGAANVSNMDGFWIQDATGLGQPTFYLDDISLAAAPVPSSVTVGVNAASVLRTVDNRHFGINTAVWDSVLPTSTTTSLMSAAGVKCLRFPGGSMSDDYDWQTGKSGSTTWATTFDEFASVATTIGAPAVFITANYGSSTPEHAAAWVQYANITKGYGFKYWEVGNENYGTWEVDNNTRPHDPVTYATRFKQYYDQMKAVDGTIKIGCPVVVGEDSYANYTDNIVTNPRTGVQHSGWTPVLLATLKNLGVTPDFVAYHYYPQGPGAEGDAGLLSSTGNWALDAADLRQQLNDYLGSAGANVELTCTENNSVFTSPGKQTTSLVNGLFLADSFCQLMKSEFKAMVWWDWRNGQETANNNSTSLYGWRTYGDYGVLNSDIPSEPADRYPTYYVFKLLQYFARGGDQMVATTSSYNGLAAYGVKQANGKVAILLINKHPTATLPANLTISGYTPPSTAYIASYGIPQDEAARTGIGSADVAQTTMTIPGASFTYNCAPYSVAAISFNPPPVSIPAAPSNLAGTAVSNSQINLTWVDNANNETGFEIDYTVQYDFSSGVTTINVTSPNVTSYPVTGLNPSSNYYFRVRATNSAGDSDNSNSINVRTPRR